MIITEETIGSEYLLVIKDGHPIGFVTKIDTKTKRYTVTQPTFDLGDFSGYYDYLMIGNRVIDSSEDVKALLLERARNNGKRLV